MLNRLRHLAYLKYAACTFSPHGHLTEVGVSLSPRRRGGSRGMFRTKQQLMTALERIDEGGGPSSGSLISIDGSKHDPDRDPFRRGFLTALEVRTELMTLMRGLDERSQRLLLLWFVHGRPVGDIAAELGISRVHCYRLRNRALDDMLGVEQERREVRAS
jgi:DNA-directed RNA polymerase specialized sigma24 family protein